MYNGYLNALNLKQIDQSVSEADINALLFFRNFSDQYQDGSFEYIYPETFYSPKHFAEESELTALEAKKLWEKGKELHGAFSFGFLATSSVFDNAAAELDSLVALKAEYAKGMWNPRDSSGVVAIFIAKRGRDNIGDAYDVMQIKRR
jgi:hypothetical protein